MTNAHATASATPFSAPQTHSLAPRIEQAGVIALAGSAIGLHFSIAIGQALFAVAAVLWVALAVLQQERIEVPRFFWPLLVYAGLTLCSAAFSATPSTSLADTKQLVLYLIVPVAFRLLSGTRGSTLLTLTMSAGAASAAFGIFQYGLLHFNQLSQRPQGTLGHYMTYSGLLMLVISIALAKLLFGQRERAWPALVMPALVLAIVLTSTRTAWVGVFAGAAVLFMLKDLRLLATLPVVGALIIALSGPIITERFASMFDRNDPTRRDRIAMLREGAHMVRDHPLLGLGPNGVQAAYAQYRVPEAVEAVNPHLHNVPMQIAAERGLPALLAWLTFVTVALVDLLRAFRGPQRVPAAAGIAAIAAMLTAGLFEYNFGDSEFLMLFLLILTIPFAAARLRQARSTT